MGRKTGGCGGEMAPGERGGGTRQFVWGDEVEGVGGGDEVAWVLSADIAALYS